MALIGNLKKIFFTGTAAYLSNGFIDIATASQTMTGACITHIERIPLPARPQEAPYDDNDGELAKAFKKVFSTESEIPYRVAANMPNSNFLLRHFHLRDIPDGEARQASVFESQKYLPFPVDELSYRISVARIKKDHHDIIFSGARTKTINAIVDFFKVRGILPSIIEPVPELIARSLRLTRQIAHNNAYISIHFEPPNRAILTEIYDMRAHSFREITLPHKDGAQTAALSYPVLGDIWPAIEGDVIGSTAFLKKETKKEIAKIFISGIEPSEDESSISKDFGVVFERPRLSYFRGASDMEHADRFLPTLSLLNDSITCPTANLAPKEILQEDLWAFKPIVKRFFAAVAAILTIHLFLSGVFYIMAGESNKLRKELNGFKMGMNASTDELTRYSMALQEKAVLINNLLTRRSELTGKLIRISGDFAPNAWIESMKFKNGVESQGATLNIDCSVYSHAKLGGSDPNSILNAIKGDQRIMRGFKSAELILIKKRRIGEGELAEFQLMLK